MTEKEIQSLIDSGKPLKELEEIFRQAIKAGELTYDQLSEAVIYREEGICYNDPGLYTRHPDFAAREFARERGEDAM